VATPVAAVMSALLAVAAVIRAAAEAEAIPAVVEAVDTSVADITETLNQGLL
jgi:hypothetical protein